jgi:hypothetical protein
MMQSRTRGISCGMIVALCLALLLPGAGLATADEPGPV